MNIGLFASLASEFLSDQIKCFRGQFGGIDVRIQEDTAQANIAALLSGKLDVAFVTGWPALPGGEVEFLWSERIYFVVPASHGLAERAEITWPDVHHEVFVVGVVTGI